MRAFSSHCRLCLDCLTEGHFFNGYARILFMSKWYSTKMYWLPQMEVYVKCTVGYIYYLSFFVNSTIVYISSCDFILRVSKSGNKSSSLSLSFIWIIGDGDFVCACVFFPGHQSVYLAWIMGWRGSNLRQWIFLNLGSVYPSRYTCKPPYAENACQKREEQRTDNGHIYGHQCGQQGCPN